MIAAAGSRGKKESQTERLRLNIGIISVRDRGYHPNRRLAEAAEERGHQVTLIEPTRAWPYLERGCRRLAGQPEIGHLDAVLPRQGATVRDSCLPLIRQCSSMGILVINSLEAVLVAKNQFLTLLNLSEAGIAVADTLFVNSATGLREAVRLLGGCPVVSKSISGRQGAGVLLLETAADVERAANEHLDDRKGLLVQRYIPPPGRRDLRVFVVGGEVVAAMQLKPEAGDFRANYHLTGKSEALKLAPGLEKTALMAAGAVGLEIAGVDLIVDREQAAKVIEVNYSPGFRGLENATGLDIAGRIISYVAGRHRRRVDRLSG